MKFLSIPLLLLGCTAPVVAPPVPSYRDQTVLIASKADFDPARFAGRWYEVARFPDPSTDRCASVITEYTLLGEGRLGLRDSCLDANGGPLGAETGQASVTGPGRLTATMASTPLPKPQWVLWTDSGYRTAVIGQPDGRAGRIMNRTPVIPADRLRAALTVLDFNGYDTRRLAHSASP